MDNKGISSSHTGHRDLFEKVIYVFFIVAIFFFLCGILLLLGPNYTAIFLMCACIFLAFLFIRELPVYLIILLLFFEAYVFSFNLFGARIRAVQVIEVVTIYIMISLVAAGRLKLKKTPLDLWIWLYIGINFIALVNAPTIDRSLKISILLLGLALLYYVIIYSISTKEIFLKVIHLALYVGLGQIVYGLYQVLAGMGRYYLGINLPVGHAGVVHQTFIKSPWGRPYGTLVEPDWYGAICMFYSVLFMILYLSNSSKRKKFFFVGLIISLCGLFFSFVRASWIGFFVVIILLMNLKKKVGLRKLRISVVYRIAVFSTILIVFFLVLSPSAVTIFKDRLMLESSHKNLIRDSRFITNKYAFESFLKNPIIGNGPGSPILSEGTLEYREAVASGLIYITNVEFPQSIITTILQNTGLLGFLFFLFLLLKYIMVNLKNIPKLDSHFQAISFALFGGVLALFISYIFTNGLWIPFTWVFLALSIVSLNISLNENEGLSKNSN